MVCPDMRGSHTRAIIAEHLYRIRREICFTCRSPASPRGFPEWLQIQLPRSFECGAVRLCRFDQVRMMIETPACYSIAIGRVSPGVDDMLSPEFIQVAGPGDQHRIRICSQEIKKLAVLCLNLRGAMA
jgi:hypothetical protein